MIWVTGGVTFIGTVWGLDPAGTVIVDTTSHTLTRVALPPIQARAASTANLASLSSVTTIDGVALAGNGLAGSDTVVLKNQTTTSQNGLYWANPTGAMCAATEPVVPNRPIRVAEGASNAHTEWTVLTANPMSVGTRSVNLIPAELDPNDFGCIGDGVHDDLPAWKAMLASISITAGARIKCRVATYYFSDNLYINRQVRIVGNAGGVNGFGGTTFLFPAGRGCYLDNAKVNAARGGDGGSADFCQITDVTFASTVMMFWAANGSNPGGGAQAAEFLGNPYTKNTGGQRVDATPYALGNVMCRGSVNNTVCIFLCTVPGMSAGSTPGSTANEPSGFASTIAGVAFTDGTVTWVSEMIPQDYVQGNTYRVGDRVFIPGNVKFYYECIQAGTSSVPATSINFDLPGFFAGSSPAQEQFTDGTLIWATRTHSSLVVTCNQGRIANCYFSNFTTAFHFLSTTGGSPLANCDHWEVYGCSFRVCGGGFYLSGFDSNGIRILNCRSFLTATGRTAKDTIVGSGGFLYKGRSLRNTVIGCYAQDRNTPATSAGPAFWTTDNDSTSFYDCDSEHGIASIFNGIENIVSRVPYTGIQWSQSNPNLAILDTGKQLTSEIQHQVQTTTNVTFQVLANVPGIPEHTAARFEIVVMGKRNGSHSSYVEAVGVCHRGSNGTGNQDVGTDTWTVTTWGSENAFNALGLTFLLQNGGLVNLVEVQNPPNYAVDWSVTVKVTLRTS
jgi:hypothetical protein